MDVISNMDPYCEVALGEKSGKTEVKHSAGTDPVWEGDEGRVELAWDGEEVLEIKVMDLDEGILDSTDDLVGLCLVSVPTLQRQGGFSGELVVYRSGTLAHGTLEVEISCSDLPDLPGGEALLQVIPAKTYRNVVAGTVHSLHEGDTLSDFRTYHVALQKVAEIFGDVCQKNYDEEHAKIFADDMKGGLIRTTIHAEHAALYRDGIRPGWLRPEGPRTSKVRLRTGPDFLQLIDGGIRGERRHVYTYAVIDSGMYFSETGAVCSKDACSKHAVHANGEAAVRYSGTFRICEDAEAAVMVVDNDSGTYRPNGDQVDLLRQLLETNLPGLRVRGLSVLEPQPEDTKDWRGPNEVKGDDACVYPGTWVWQY
mmetsp:Transcript_10246/g.20561  ORF Transcript_10246/g.20561 Transcript_10246/m.20561 type:complete len:368 (-) Transcript_10246:82-1185(-)